MSDVVDLETLRRGAPLRDWAQECRNRMAARWPNIDFDSNKWPLRTLYKTKIANINLESVLADFEDKDPAYRLALRSLVAEVALQDKLKSIADMVNGWRLLAGLDTLLSDLKQTQLKVLEDQVVEGAKANPGSARKALSSLDALRKQLDRVAQRNAIDRLTWSPSHDTRRALNKLSVESRSNFRASKASVLDRQIEALSDALRTALTNDPRLQAPLDRTCLAVMGILMCAPSRINEPLCLSIDDRFVLQDYVVRPIGKDDDVLHRAHQLLLMKGSKGADWGAKPILNFMVALADRCWEIVLQNGQRSRMLAQWYEDYPNRLYLPSELEHLRGQDIDRNALWQIMNLAPQAPGQSVCSVGIVWADLKKVGSIKMIDNPRAFTVTGVKTPHSKIEGVSWSDLEPVLLERVQQAMADCRRVTEENHYQGRLSKMLMLVDRDTTPYLPSSVKYHFLKCRMKLSPSERKEMRPNTIFEKLDIKMVDSDGVVKHAWIDTHDPRRWLTTQAIAARECLSDVLVNKWANRLNIDQLTHYDLRSGKQKAEQAAMPEVNELADMTAGLAAVASIEEEYGLSTEIVTAHEAGISVTSMNAICNATENRAIARTSNQIVILYPSKYGACLHQHHETPCRAYNCLPCDNNLVVKGHIPTNDAIRVRNDQLHKSIVFQLDALLMARQREIADSPETLDGHILTLVREGLNAEEMAVGLVERFHEIKAGIKDLWFRNMLEEAFVAHGMVSRLDSPGVASGALIKYHNPSCHAAPGHERAIDAVYGGRAAMQAKLEAFERKHSEFAPSSLGLKDERYLLEAEDDQDDEDDAA